MELSFKPNSQTSFRRHLTTVVTIGVLALSITASLITSWVTSKNLHNVLVDNAIQLTQSLADQSVLALLYGSGENAEDAVNVAMSFPSITQVMILTQDGNIILSSGDEGVDYEALSWPDDGAKLLLEEIDHWVFMAPVYATGGAQPEDDIMLMQMESERELLGYVIVAKNKDRLREIQSVTVFNNLIIGLLFATILVYILRQRFKHLTDPLYELSETMLEAQQEGSESHPYAKINGPKEVVQIAIAYNKMMEVLAERDQQLREHNEHLESEVALRTQELVYARDIAEEANRNKSQFLANVTHELRTPLQAIIGYTDLICETVPEDLEDVHHDLESIMVNAQNLLGLINEILDLSKVESGRMELNLHSEDLSKLLSQVIDTVTPIMQKNSNHLTVESDLTDERFMVDGVKLRQILLNLLSNAAKFTDNGEVKIHAKYSEGNLNIAVIDSGIGIDKEHQSIIFDAFRQVDGSHTRKYQGTGLGLAISQKFCEMMGGNIELDSEIGKGATFSFSIPLQSSK